MDPANGPNSSLAWDLKCPGRGHTCRLQAAFQRTAAAGSCQPLDRQRLHISRQLKDATSIAATPGEENDAPIQCLQCTLGCTPRKRSPKPKRTACATLKTYPPWLCYRGSAQGLAVGVSTLSLGTHLNVCFHLDRRLEDPSSAADPQQQHAEPGSTVSKPTRAQQCAACHHNRQMLSAEACCAGFCLLRQRGAPQVLATGSAVMEVILSLLSADRAVEACFSWHSTYQALPTR